MRVLGIESSCDETAAAVVTADGVVESDVVRSQIDLHAAFGGIVPEIAARDHARVVTQVVHAALDQARATLADVDAIAVTSRPGLAGALLVGLSVGKGIAWAQGKPLVGVDHLVGHLLSVFLVHAPSSPPPMPAFPYVALLASGGHTGLYRVDGPVSEQMRELGGTRDDAAGEAFDKVAKLLGLGYPGGPVIDRLAAEGDAEAFRSVVPRPMASRASLEFSFSGIKSAIARHVERHGAPSGAALSDLCAAFQSAVVDTLVAKAVRAAESERVPRVVLGGGVAANRGLRAAMRRACEARGIEVFIPPIASCTDNAAMIALAGARRLAAGRADDASLAPHTHTCLPRVTRKGRGPRSAPRAPNRPPARDP